MTPSLGQTLSDARHQRGLTLADVAHATKITPTRLRWLEQDDYAAFANLAYARAFLRHYSEFLGIDAYAVLTRLTAARPVTIPRHPAHGVPFYHMWGGPAQLRPSAASTGPERVPHHSRPSVPAAPLAAIFLVCLSAASLWGHWVARDFAAREQARLAPIGLEPGYAPTPHALAHDITPAIAERQAGPVLAKGPRVRVISGPPPLKVPDGEKRTLQ